jgi:DNA-binding MarR family transcriptional regulator
LLELRKEVSRIATTLARLAMESNTRPLDAGSVDGVDVPEVSPEIVASMIRARRRREFHFPKELLADPAWDMMVELLHAELLQQRVQVSRLCVATGVPATTALRWLKTLVKHGLAVRRPDPLDQRRVYVELSPRGSAALRRYFAELDAGA